MMKPASWMVATALLAFVAPASAEQPSVKTGVAASEMSSQQRPRTRITITPRRQVPLDRRAYRQCQDWLDLEHRPSGTVLVPKMRCWWVRG